jgi:carboxylesterase type B
MTTPISLRFQLRFEKATIFALVNLNFRKHGISIAFKKHVENMLNQDNAAKFKAFYGIDDNTSDSRAIGVITAFVTDIAFYAPSINIAKEWPGATSVGHFNERNPWEGPYQGKTNHLLDIAFVWGNYNQSYRSENWTVARALAENLISFTNEKDDLKNFKDSGLVTVYGPSDEKISSREVEWESKDTERNTGIFKLSELVGGLDNLLNLAHGFLAL